MFESTGIHEEIICQDPGLNLVLSHIGYPWLEQEGHEGHGEGAPLRDGAPVFVWLAECGPYLVVYD